MKTPQIQHFTNKILILLLAWSLASSLQVDPSFFNSFFN